MTSHGSRHYSTRRVRLLAKKRIEQYEREDNDCDDDGTSCVPFGEKDIFPQPFTLIRITMLWRELVHRYSHERKGIAALTTECDHHLPIFHNNPKEFASYILTADKTKYINMRTINVCKSCVHLLAAELAAMLLRGEKLQHPDLIYQLLVSILQYPSLARYYLHHKQLWKHVMRSHRRCCQRVVRDHGGDGDIEKTSMTVLFMFGCSILRNGYLMRNQKYWRRNVGFLMDYILKTAKRELLIYREEGSAIGSRVILMVQWKIILFLYYQHQVPWKLQKKYRRYVRNFRRDIQVLHDIIDFGGECMHKRGIESCIKEYCCHLLEMMDDKSSDLGVNIVKIQKKIWIMKREDMECLWIKCDRKAKDLKAGRLQKCRNCRVARYCSKSCQKKDWKYGNHKDICQKFVDLNRIKF